MVTQTTQPDGQSGNNEKIGDTMDFIIHVLFFWGIILCVIGWWAP